MSGIVGIIDKSASPRYDWDDTSKSQITAMLGSLQRRGPHSQNWDACPGALLGTTRLAIQDLSPRAKQPVTNAAGTIRLVYNGEIYNSPQLRRELEQDGYPLVSDSDSAVLLALYERDGAQLLDHLNGMYAFIIHDTRSAATPKTLLARDPFGIKPLLYHMGADYLYFASELKAFLNADLVSTDVNALSLYALLAQGAVPQPLTWLREVRSLLPGEVWLIEQGDIHKRFHGHLQPGRTGELARMPWAEKARALRQTLNKSFQSQTIGDRPFGILLSSGLDSVAMTALLTEHSNRPLQTFTLGFTDARRDHDESEAASHIAQHFCTDHTRLEVNGNWVATHFTDFVCALDQPSVDGLNNYILSAMVRDHVTVALSGCGGDDWFLAYPWHGNLTLNPPPALRLLASHAAAMRNFHNLFTPQEALALMSDEMRDNARELASEYNPALGDRLADAPQVDRLTALTLYGYTANQLLRDLDRVSMANGVEFRLPYLDKDIADFMLSLPPEDRMPQPQNRDLEDPMTASYALSGSKRLLITAVEDRLPMDFVKSRKRDFRLPLKPWLQNQLHDFVQTGFEPGNIAQQGLFDPAQIQAQKHVLLDNPSPTLYGRRLWLLTVINAWQAQYA